MSVCRLLAPFAPFVTDWIHRELTGESVHLAPFVRTEPDALDPALDGAMRAIRTLARLGRAAREEAGIKVRQPLVADGVRRSGRERGRCSSPARSAAGRGAQRQAGGVRLVRRRARDARGEAELPLAGQEVGKETPLAAQAVAAFTSDDAPCVRARRAAGR